MCIPLHMRARTARYLIGKEAIKEKRRSVARAEIPLASEQNPLPSGGLPMALDLPWASSR